MNTHLGRALTLAVIGLLGAGCGEEVIHEELCAWGGAPDGNARITGQVLDADGNPSPGVAVELRRDYVLDLFDLLGTKQMEPRALSSNAEGKFTTVLSEHDHAGGSGQWPTFHLTAGGAEAQFEIRSSVVDVPALRPWTGDTTAETTADGVRIAYTRIADEDRFGSVRYEVKVATEDALEDVWVFYGRDETTSFTFTPELAEDLAPHGWHVTAQGYTCQSRTEIRHLLPQGGSDLPQEVKGDVPPSRGAACTGDTERTAEDCPLTDGYPRPIALTSAFADPPSEVTVDLGKTLKVRRVILRGLMPSGPARDRESFLKFHLRTELADGGSFHTVDERVLTRSADGCGRHPSGKIICYLAIDLPEPEEASQVKVSLFADVLGDVDEEDYRLHALGELSVWE